MNQGPQVRGHHEVGPGSVGEDEPRILAWNARSDQFAIQIHRTRDLVLIAGPYLGVGSRDRVGEHGGGLLVGHVALALLIKGDAGAMADELVGEGP